MVRKRRPRAEPLLATLPPRPARLVSMNEPDVPDGERPKIKVTDRRLFDSDGNLRDEAPSPPSDDPATAPTGAAAPEPGGDLIEAAEASSDDAPEVVPSVVPSEVEDVASTGASDATQKAASRLKLDDQALLKFIEEQYVGGLLALGAMPEPQSGQMVEDLDMARLRVEVLGLLQESTEGERSDDTSKALEDVLYQLRLAYLQKRKVAKL